MRIRFIFLKTSLAKCDPVNCYEVALSLYIGVGRCHDQNFECAHAYARTQGLIFPCIDFEKYALFFRQNSSMSPRKDFDFLSG